MVYCIRTSILACVTGIYSVDAAFVAQASTVGELKRQIHAKDPALPPHLQKITFHSEGTVC